MKQIRFKYCLYIFMPIIFMYIFNYFFSIAYNETPSVKHSFFFVIKHQNKPKKGDYILFNATNNKYYKKAFLKIVGGEKGDHVTRINNSYYINDNYIGDAKEYSLSGERLEFSSTGLIPEGKYFVFTNHKDSYDSRYKEIGWIDSSDIIGIAYPIY